jgi:2-aminoadipate transaminase
MNEISPDRVKHEVARPAFARWLGTTNDITRGFLAAGRILGLINPSHRFSRYASLRDEVPAE